MRNKPWFSWWQWQEFKIVLGLALPIMIGQLAQTGMGFMDTLMAGQVSAEDLAGVALGSAVWLPVYLFASGILLLLTPKVATDLGAEASDHLRLHLYQAVVMAIILAVVSSLILWTSSVWLTWFSLEARVYQVSRDYLHYLTVGVWFGLAFQVIRFWFDGFALTRYAMLLAMIGFMVNIPLNYAFIYGWWIFPALGGAGCGVATTLSYLMMAVIGWLWFYRQSKFAEHHGFWQYDISLMALANTLWHWTTKGVPIAASILFEVGLFIVVAFLLTPLGTEVLAAHQIAISYTSMVFMFPLSLAMAMTVRVGFLRGQADHVLLRHSVLTLLVVALGMGVALSLFTFMFNQGLAEIYNKDPEVVALASFLMLFAGIYQLSDAIQAFCAGVLRGVMDTVAVMWVTLVAYWLVALPVGYWLCYGLEWGVSGFWMSFVIGLTLAAVGLGWRMYHLLWQDN
jgi:MATE family multidrug resistance protein